MVVSMSQSEFDYTTPSRQSSRFVPSRRSSAGECLLANRCNVWRILELRFTFEPSAKVSGNRTGARACSEPISHLASTALTNSNIFFAAQGFYYHRYSQLLLFFSLGHKLFNVTCNNNSGLRVLPPRAGPPQFIPSDVSFHPFEYPLYQVFI